MSRRRMMMQSGGMGTEYLPLVINSWTDKELIDMYGNLFDTIKKAPKEYQGKDRLFAFAIDKEITSFSFQNIGSNKIVYYEDGVVKYSGPASTLQITDNVVSKHIIVYGFDANFYGSSRIAKWFVYLAAYNCSPLINNLTIPGGFYQLHYPRYAQYFYYSGSFYFLNAFPNAKSNESCVWFPDNSMFRINDWRGGSVKKIRLPKSITVGGYYWIYLEQSPTDFYVHWGLEDTIPNITSCGNTLGNNCKLHIPNLGNDNLNNQLRNAYIENGWNTSKFKQGIYNDVEETEPEFPY